MGERKMGTNAGIQPPDQNDVNTANSPVAAYTLYLSPEGSDSASGLTVDEALLTLDGVQTKLKLDKPTIDQDIEVRILFIPDKPYRGQEKVTWTHTSPTHSISFMPSDYQDGMGFDDIAGRPTFDGEGLPSFWFDLHSSKGEATNLHFYYLRVESYINGAIRFLGTRASRSPGWNGYNRVYGCYFFQCGSQHRKGGYKYISGTAGIDLVNSRNNRIEYNLFRDLEDELFWPDGREQLQMHGVYLAHSSDHNVIEHNRFRNISGDPIRVRDYSNHNEIISNMFTRAGKCAFLSEWHGDEECLSWENKFLNNSPLECGYYGQNSPLGCGNDGGPIRNVLHLGNNIEGSECQALGSDFTDLGNASVTCP
jgi:hypothetical protein